MKLMKLNNMKTIEEAAIEHAKNLFFESSSTQYLCKGDFTISFIEGVEFAQQFYPIERDKDGFTTLKQDEEFQNNFPILVKGNYGIELLNELTTVLEKPGHGYTHWRPINLK